MNVLIVTKGMMAGGTERVISQLAEDWSNHGITCSLLLIEKREKQYSISDKVKIFEIGTLHSNLYFDKVKKYLKVRKIVKEINPDIVLSMPEEIGIYVILSLLGTGIPVVVSERNDPWIMPYKKASRFLRRIMYPYAKGLIFQTKQAASFFSKRNQEKGIVLQNPLVLSRIPNPYNGERKKIVVGAGRLHPQKNFKLLIDAFYDFYQTHLDYKLVIYGEGALRKELEEYACKLPTGVVSLPGVSPRLLEVISDHSMFVLSSDYEGTPNALIEAMSMGMPVISTDCSPGGAANLINNGKNGILVAAGDRTALANAMCQIAENTEIAENMGIEATKIKEELDSKKVCQEWLNYLKSVIN